MYKKLFCALFSSIIASSCHACAEFPLYALWDADVMHRWLAGGIAIRKTDKQGFTPLHWAAYYGRDVATKQLIAAGVPVDVLSKYRKSNLTFGKTALYLAAKRGHLEVAKSLVVAGANQQVLIKAVRHNHCIAVQTLLQAGVNPDIQDDYQWTALSYAACFREQEIVTLLLAAHANANIQDAYGETALHLACWNRKKENVRLLIPYTNLAIKNKWGSTPLKHAAGFQDIVQLFATHQSNQQMIAFLSASIPRLGQHSPARVLPYDSTIVRQIYYYLLLYNARPTESVEMICKGWPWWKNI